MRDPLVTSHIMASIKSRNTKPEILLGNAMWDLGLRYRKKNSLIGHPDFVFINKKIAVFCDGDFWHGNNWYIRGLRSLDDELESYSPYWREKIKGNIERDIRVNIELKNKGWKVVRFWESDIKKDVNRCAHIVEGIFKE